MRAAPLTPQLRSKKTRECRRTRQGPQCTLEGMGTPLPPPQATQPPPPSWPSTQPSPASNRIGFANFSGRRGDSRRRLWKRGSERGWTWNGGWSGEGHDWREGFVMDNGRQGLDLVYLYLPPSRISRRPKMPLVVHHLYNKGECVPVFLPL